MSQQASITSFFLQSKSKRKRASGSSGSTSTRKKSPAKKKSTPKKKSPVSRAKKRRRIPEVKKQQQEEEDWPELEIPGSLTRIENKDTKFVEDKPDKKSTTKQKSSKRSSTKRNIKSSAKSNTKSSRKKNTNRRRSTKRKLGSNIEVSTTSGPTKKAVQTKADMIAEEEAKKEEKARKRSGWLAFQNRGPPPMAGLKEIPTGKPYCLRGKIFLFTGVCESLERDQGHELVERYGGSIAKSVTKKLTHAVIGNEPGQAKLTKINARSDIHQLDEDGLFEMIKTLPEQEPPTIVPKKRTTKSKSTWKAPVRRKVDTSSLPKPRQDLKFSLWADKYRPYTTSELVGNPSPLAGFKKWLQGWDDPKNTQKAALLSGPPGIGKTTAAILVCKQYGYSPIEFNASDTRSKKSLKEHVYDAVNNRALGEFYSKVGEKTNKTHKMALIMDEVDGMSGGDRGGTTELLNMIKKTKVPIICICNDRQSRKLTTIAKYCKDFRFKRPTPRQMLPRIQHILETEHIKFQQSDLERIVTFVNGDIRQVLNLLQMWCANSKVINTKEVTERLNSSKKNLDLGPFDVPPKLFTVGGRQLSINEKISLYFIDRSMVPLLVQENVYKLRPAVIAEARNISFQERQRRELQMLSKVADSISDADLIDKVIGHSQLWTLAPAHAVMSTITPCAYMCGRSSTRVDFPRWLGKYSQKARRYRELGDLYGHTRKYASANKMELAMQYIPNWKASLLTPMKTNGKDGIQDTINFMDSYGITREDWDTILEIENINNSKTSTIPGSVKTQFTRRYNASHHAHKVASKAATNVVMRESPDVDEGNNNNNDDDDDEDDVGKDALIKQKKKRTVKKKNQTKSKKKQTKPKTKRTTTTTTKKRTSPRKRSNTNKSPLDFFKVGR